jgi:uncharacterized protein (DUF362 family)
MNRREFCRTMALAGGGALLPEFISSCASTVPPPPTSTITPSPSAIPILSPTLTATPTPEPTSATATRAVNTARVALIKTSDRTEGVRRAIDLLGINPMRGDRVLLKPNFNSADESPGSTHLDTLRALISKLNELGARAITLADRSGMGDTRRVLEQRGVLALSREMGFTAVMLDELGEKEWVIRQSKEFHWTRGFAMPRMLLDADSMVQTCNLKTHRYGGHFTMSLKNSVGLAAKTIGASGYNYMSELHGSPHQRHMIAELNTGYTPSLIVMDGIEAFVDGGPDRGTRVKSEIVLAGIDRVAMDAVGVAILRMFGTTPEVSRGKIFDQEQIARAVELGLGIDSPMRIEFVTNDADSAAYARRIQTALGA